MTSYGVATPSSIAEAAVTILNVDPGSYVSLTPRLVQASRLYFGYSFGLNVGKLAIPKISPVEGDIAIREIPFGRVLAAAAATSFSRMYWIFSSMVVIRFSPGNAGCSTLLKLRPRASAM